MQERLVVLARIVEVLNQPQKARTIEGNKRGLDVNPSWRSIFLLGHDPNLSAMNWGVSFLTCSLKIHEFGADPLAEGTFCLTPQPGAAGLPPEAAVQGGSRGVRVGPLVSTQKKYGESFGRRFTDALDRPN
jgi:hypothetical protein